ncbi:MAG: FHA domain-containing protein [Kiritimatiellae bacterium]|nr:FHA domain-containing protein [Kiritimatiellia bacterium]MDD5520721.1 FHA domain-containing protein [Kiritimatiellia bacterium]
MMYRLIFLSGNLKGQKITVDDSAPMTIGHDPECSINIIDSEIASKHAVLEHNSLTGLHINDLGSMNKILVNNHEVREAHLKHGDIVELGRTRFLVQATVETDLTKNAPKTRIRHISLTPLLIIIPLFVVIYAVVSFCQKIIRESSHVHPTPVVVSLPPSNAAPTQAVTRLVYHEEKPTNTAVSAESLKPISDEIRQMREDLVGIKQTVKELAIQPLTPSTSAPPSNITQPRQTAGQPTSTPVNTSKTSPATTVQKASPPQKIEPPDPQIKISYHEQQKFKENEDFDEMRIITIGLLRQWPVKNMNDNIVRVEISFFDQIANTTTVVPTRAVVPTKPLKPSQWVQDTQAVVTAAYVIPKGSRKTVRNVVSEQYYGYVVRVFYGNKLQDEDARPKTLLHYSSGTLRKQHSSTNISQLDKQ